MENSFLIEMPKVLDLDGALKLSKSFSNLPNSSCYKFDFSKLEFLEPFGMLYFSAKLRDFRSKQKDCRFIAVNYEKHTYAAHMGFFRSFGLKYGNDTGEATGSMQYVPITKLNLDDLSRQAYDNYEDVRESIERLSMKLADVLVRSNSGPLYETVGYSLREIIRNVYEHSNSNVLWYSAQYWPNKSEVELSILDEGDGILKSLSKNPHLKITSSFDAIQLSLLPGISGVAFKGGPKQKNDPWANSGYGLFMTSKLCMRGGSFVIISGDAGLHLDNNQHLKLDCDFKGTAIRLVFDVTKLNDLSKSLEGLRNEGAKIALSLKQSANITASMSSRMLINKDN